MFQCHDSSRMREEVGLHAASSNASADARQALSEVNALRHDVERLFMIAEALWEILREKHGYTEEDLIRRIAMIDLRDGKLDGRATPVAEGPAHCAQCGRPVGRKRPFCIYCGAAVVMKPFEH